MSPDDLDPTPSDPPAEALRVISRLYDTLTNRADYDPMLIAMDDFIDTQLAKGPAGRETADLRRFFGAHFQQVGEVFDLLMRDEEETPVSYVDRQASATAIVDASGKLVARNEAFDKVFGSDGAGPSDLTAFFASPDDASRLAAIARTNRMGMKTILSVAADDAPRNMALLLSHARGVTGYRADAPLLSATLIQPTWTTALGDMLAEAFHLTAAELETLQAFVESGSVQGIAERRGRSIRTVRTQLSRIFAQMGMSGQTELAMFLAAAGQLQGTDQAEAYTAAARPLDADRDLGRRVVTTSQGPVEVLEYGDPKGLPVLLLQSTHPPDLTAPFRRALEQAGLRILAPLKPGAGQTARQDKKAGPAALAPLYRDAMLAHGVKRAVVAGQASGGLYALEFARQFPSLTQALCLIDTGVPFPDKRALLNLPPANRRTMLPARYFPEMLLLPHRLVADKFETSPKGQAKVVDYFFQDSPEDQHLTRTDRTYYEITRAIIAYSFLDTDRLVRDVAAWASDWSDLLEDVAAQTRLRFVQGNANLMFRCDAIQRFLDRGWPRADLVELPGGQLAAYQSADAVAHALADLARSTQNEGQAPSDDR